MDEDMANLSELAIKEAKENRTREILMMIELWKQKGDNIEVLEEKIASLLK